jgi:hypothetical protein
MSRAGTMATCTATCDGLHGRQLPERDQRVLTPQRECGVLWRRSARSTKFSVSRDAPPALHASAHHGAPPFFPTGEPRRAHRDAADGAIYTCTPTTAPPIRPRRRHLHAHDGATHTPTTAPSTRPRRRHLHAHELGARESAGLLWRACDGLRPPQGAARPLACDQLDVDQSPHSWADGCLG